MSHHHYVYIYEVNNLLILSIKSLPLKHPWEESQTMPVKVNGENQVKKTVAIVTHCVQKIWLVQDMICIYVHKGRFHTPVTASLGFRPLHSPGRKSTNQDMAYLFVAQYKNMIVKGWAWMKPPPSPPVPWIGALSVLLLHSKRMIIYTRPGTAWFMGFQVPSIPNWSRTSNSMSGKSDKMSLVSLGLRSL